MAGKKWQSWIVGVSGVLSFVAFLDLTQQREEAGAAAEPIADAGDPASGQTEAALPPPSAAADGQQTGDIAVRLFMHSRAEFDQLAALTAEAADVRSRMLEGLDWDADGSEGLIAPAIRVIVPSNAAPEGAAAPKAQAHSAPQATTPSSSKTHASSSPQSQAPSSSPQTAAPKTATPSVAQSAPSSASQSTAASSQKAAPTAPTAPQTTQSQPAAAPQAPSSPQATAPQQAPSQVTQQPEQTQQLQPRVRTRIDRRTRRS